MARNSLLCADVPLRNYSLTHSLRLHHSYTNTPGEIRSLGCAHTAQYTGYTLPSGRMHWVKTAVWPWCWCACNDHYPGINVLEHPFLSPIEQCEDTAVVTKYMIR